MRRDGLSGTCLAFYEILDLAGDLRRYIDVPTQELELEFEFEAFARGHKSLAHDGLRLVLEGRTALEEITRITGGQVEEIPLPSFMTTPPRRPAAAPAADDDGGGEQPQAAAEG